MKTVRDIISATRIYGDYVVHRPLYKIHKRKRGQWSQAQGNMFPNSNLLFIHIPKAAGTTLRQTLLDIETHTSVSGEAKSKTDLSKLPKHIKAKDLRTYMGSDEFEKYFTFTFVRNPWDLMVSSFFWWRQHAINFRGLMYTSAIIREMNFEEYINSLYGKYFINEWHGTMSEWFQEDGRDIVDYIGRVESLDYDLKKIIQINGITERYSEIPKLNESLIDKGSYRKYYSQNTKKIVEDRFADVIERFDYKF